MALIPTPQTPVYRFLRQPFAYDIAVAYFAAFGGLAGILRFADVSVWAVVPLMSLGVAGVLSFSLLKSYVSYQEAKRTESTHELEGCLHSLHSTLQRYDPDHVAGIRVTVHVPSGDEKHFIQAMDYVGDDRGGKNTGGRKFPAHAGVIGECKRTFEPIYGRRGNHVFAEYVNELVNDWKFCPGDARNRNQQTMSWLAIPLVDADRRLAGVVYADSIVPDFFDEDCRRDDAGAICVGIARFVDKRYG